MDFQQNPASIINFRISRMYKVTMEIVNLVPTLLKVKATTTSLNLPRNSSIQYSGTKWIVYWSDRISEKQDVRNNHYLP